MNEAVPTKDEREVAKGQAFEFALAEYKEVSQNVRESWNYITALLRHYLFIQIVLLSLVGLGNSAISTTATTFTGTVSQAVPRNQQNDSTARGETTHISIEERDALTREARLKKLARYTAIGALILIGFALSLGAWRQSHRMFLNAAAFVQRAAALENKYGINEISLQSKKAASMHVYMHQRLTDPNIFKMENALSTTYVAGMVLWGFMAFIIAVPFVG